MNNGGSSLYRRFLSIREGILVNKWLESEKAGHDVGFETALVGFVRDHRKTHLAKLNNGEIPLPDHPTPDKRTRP